MPRDTLKSHPKLGRPVCWLESVSGGSFHDTSIQHLFKIDFSITISTTSDGNRRWGSTLFLALSVPLSLFLSVIASLSVSLCLSLSLFVSLYICTYNVLSGSRMSYIKFNCRSGEKGKDGKWNFKYCVKMKRNCLSNGTKKWKASIRNIISWNLWQ